MECQERIDEQAIDKDSVHNRTQDKEWRHVRQDDRHGHECC